MTDAEIMEMWDALADVSMNPEKECIEQDFHIWKAGTSRYEIWQWFDKNFSRGVAVLMYGEVA